MAANLLRQGYQVSGFDIMPEALEKLQQAGGTPYIIPGGGSNPVGALGYVDCAREIVVQADEMDLELHRIVTATGSAGTHAGLVAGLARFGLWPLRWPWLLPSRATAWCW